MGGNQLKSRMTLLCSSRRQQNSFFLKFLGHVIKFSAHAQREGILFPKKFQSCYLVVRSVNIKEMELLIAKPYTSRP